LQSISKKIPGRVLKETKENARILWATFGKAGKGFDEARLSGGVDASPRSAQEQIHGRILRGKASKPPIWVTTLDWNNPRLLKSFIARIQDYLKSNGEIYEWLEDGGLQSWEPKDLIDHVQQQLRTVSALRIETGSDGRYTLLTQKQSALKTSSGIRPTTRPPSASRAASTPTVSAVRLPRSRPPSVSAPSSATRLLRQRRP
jgi:hypothetical protein